MSKNTNDLLVAVDALSKPHVSKVLQFNGRGESTTATINHPARLAHLRASIVGGIGSHVGGSGETRLPFDAGALELYVRIENEISSWFVQLTEKPVYSTPEQTLRNWYIAFQDAHSRGKVTDGERKARAATLRGWQAQIDGMFDPPRVLELMAPCPECGERIAFDPKTGDQITAVVVSYHEEGPSTVENATVTCRSCESTWKGGSGCRAVAWEIEQQGESDDH